MAELAFGQNQGLVWVLWLDRRPATNPCVRIASQGSPISQEIRDQLFGTSASERASLTCSYDWNVICGSFLWGTFFTWTHGRDGRSALRAAMLASAKTAR